MIAILLQEIWCSRRSILNKLSDVSSSVSTCKSKQRLLRAQNRVSSHWRYLNPPQKSFIMQSKCPLYGRFNTSVQTSKSGVFWLMKIRIFAILTYVQMFDVKMFFHFAEPFKIWKHTYPTRWFINDYQNNLFHVPLKGNLNSNLLFPLMGKRSSYF